ncbi:MAG: MBL fold metallo-hydrolase [Gammaproteobacteria bacterium]|jgi:glyoxylase-like metal-dependent hydrolase (beta-lactamase superfamily II)
MKPRVEPFLHEPTDTYSYLVDDPETGKAAVIDPVLDFDAASGRVGTESADRIIQRVRALDLDVEWILETHAHADHLSAGGHLRAKLGGQLAIGQGITHVQATFIDVFNLQGQVANDGSQFDHLFEDNEEFTLGSIVCRAIPTPGHTSDSLSYLIGDAVFVGDTLFMWDTGTGRCDFPGGDAGQLYESIQRLFALPGETRLFLLHDYPPEGREHACETTVAEQRERNVHIHQGVSREEYIKLREARDATLAVPRLLYPSLQVNIRGGRLPDAENDGRRFLKLPLTTE